MFWGATSFNQPLDKWDVSNVKNTTAMFRDAKSFNQNLNSWRINKETLTRDTCMFYNTPALNKSNVSKISFTPGENGEPDKDIEVPASYWNSCSDTVGVFTGTPVDEQ